jgi:hypothetical protein
LLPTVSGNLLHGVLKLNVNILRIAVVPITPQMAMIVAIVRSSTAALMVHLFRRDLAIPLCRQRKLGAAVAPPRKSAYVPGVVAVCDLLQHGFPFGKAR